MGGYTLQSPSGQGALAAFLTRTLACYVRLYNNHLPQKALNYESPIQALKRWQSTHQELFARKVQDRPGPDT